MHVANDGRTVERGELRGVSKVSPREMQWDVAEAILIVVTMSFRPSDVLGRQFNAPLLVAGGGAGACLVVVGNAIP